MSVPAGRRKQTFCERNNDTVARSSIVPVVDDTLEFNLVFATEWASRTLLLMCGVLWLYGSSTVPEVSAGPNRSPQETRLSFPGYT